MIIIIALPDSLVALDDIDKDDLPLPCRLILCIIQYNAIQYNNTIQYNTIQYNTMLYNTIQYKIVHLWSNQYLLMSVNRPQLIWWDQGFALWTGFRWYLISYLTLIFLAVLQLDTLSFFYIINSWCKYCSILNSCTECWVMMIDLPWLRTKPTVPQSCNYFSYISYASMQWSVSFCQTC